MEKKIRLKRGRAKRPFQIREYISQNGFTKITVVRGKSRGRHWIIYNATRQYLYDIEINDFFNEKRSLFSPDNEKAVRELLEDKKVMEDAFTYIAIELRDLRVELSRYEYAFESIRDALESGEPLSIDYTLSHILEPVKKLQKRAAEEAQEKYKTERARNAAMARHSAPGGSRSKRDRLIDIWASGKYTSRDLCAEEECGHLGVSYTTARKYLYGTPEPVRC